MKPRQKDPVQYVIIGNSAAGISAAAEIRRHDPAGRITMISDEPAFGYSRVLLPLYLAGKKSKKEMLIAPRAFYTSRKIRLLRGDGAEAIDPKDQRVRTASGIRLPYDRLLIATGSSPRKLEVRGNRLPGIHYLRKMADAEAIRADLVSSRGPVLVVGGGLVSLKSAEALIARKRKVHLVISSDRVLSMMLDEGASRFFPESLRRNGVGVHLHADVKAFQGNTRLQKALLSDGTALDCALAIVGKGVVPNVDFLKGTGISLDQGIIVDRHMATNIPCVYAAGDVAEVIDLLAGKHAGNAIWPLSMEGGRIAGSNMAGTPATLPGGLRMNVVEILGTRIVSVGEWNGERQIESSLHSNYRKLVFSGNRLLGFILAGDIRGAGFLTSLVKNQGEVDCRLLEQGLAGGFSYGPRFETLGGHVQPREMGNCQ